jgi:hypothetical protein
MARYTNVDYSAIYGTRRFVNATNAFDAGYQEAYANGIASKNKTKSVKNLYEQKLRNYLKQLPADIDLSQIPDKYRNTLSNYLSKQKNEYVRAANILDELVVGSDDYMQTVSKMNNVKSAFENLDKQFKLYGQNKKEIIDDIEGQTISLYGENQESVNLLRGIFNEEYELEIDDTGNLFFMGEDGKISLNDLPDYGIKDYETAEKMMTMGSQVYQNGYKSGITLTPDSIMYHQYQNTLKRLIDQGGKNTIMSMLYDGLVGDIVMAEDPIMQKMIEGFRNGSIGFDQLRDATVDNFMKVLIKQSQTGVSKRPKSTNTRTTSRTNKPTATDIKNQNKVNKLIDAFNNKNINDIELYLPTNIEIQEDDGVFYIDGKIIDLGDPKSFLDILRYAKIDPIYWPQLTQEENTEETNEQTNSNVGAADNF